MNNDQTSVDNTVDDKTKTTTSSDTTVGTASDDMTTTDTPAVDEPIVDEPVVDDGREYYSEQTITNPIKVTNSFESVNSTILIGSGNTFSVIDSANASIALELTTIENEDSSSVFLNIVNSPNTTLTFRNQVSEGDIVLDGLSSLSFILSDESYYMGVINGGNTAQSVSVSLDNTSQLILAGNTYISELKNADATNMNIFGNGHKLYVAGNEVAINGSDAPKIIKNEVAEDEIESGTSEEYAAEEKSVTTGSDTNLVPYIVGGAAILIIIIAVIVFILHNKKKKGDQNDGMNAESGTPNGGRPDFSQFDDGPVQQPNDYAAPEQTPPATPPSTPTPNDPAQPTPPSDSQEPYVGQM